MNKKYIVRLSDEERGVCQEIAKRLKGSSEKVRRARILPKADGDGPGWSEAKIAEACKSGTGSILGSMLATSLPFCYNATAVRATT